MTTWFLGFLTQAYAIVTRFVSDGAAWTLQLFRDYGTLFSMLMNEAPGSTDLIRDCTLGLVLLTLLGGLLVFLVILPLFHFIRAHFLLIGRTCFKHSFLSLAGILAACGLCVAAGLYLGNDVHALYDRFIPANVPFLEPFMLSAAFRHLILTLAGLQILWLGLGLPASVWKLLLFAPLAGACAYALFLPVFILSLIAALLVPAHAYDLKPLHALGGLFFFLRRRR